MSRKTIASLVLLVIIDIGACLGIFAAIGICAALWAGDSIDPILRNHRDHWVFYCLLVPAMIVGMAGSLAVFYWPLCHFFPWFASELNERWHMGWLRWERRCADAWVRHLDAEIDRLETTKAKTLESEL